MQAKDFSFVLPKDLIAQNPVFPRDTCKLMVLDRNNQTINHHRFYDLPGFLRKTDVLVMNDTRVLPARFFFEFEGKIAELFLLRRVIGTRWLAIGKPGKILTTGRVFQIAPGFEFEVLEAASGGQKLIAFHVEEQELENLIQKHGKTPLPPYIVHSSSLPEDYQTVYARETGSVAAPTAGLHFTQRLLDKIKTFGVDVVFVTLHVGLGTFQPIKTVEVKKHIMHSEIFELSPQSATFLQTAKNDGRRIIAVGTTSVRVLESSYDLQKGFQAQTGETSIYIYPGYSWKCVDGLITNFHLSQSTLLLLTCSFGGKKFVLRAYDEAVREKYRFFSFGDAMFIY